MTLTDPGDPAGAPPPPGIDTPVPVDAEARAAAAGRARRLPAMPPTPADRLVPAKALETRAEERARLRRERLALGSLLAPGSATPPTPGSVAPQAVPNPGAGLARGSALPPGLMPAVAESMPQRLVPNGWAQPDVRPGGPDAVPPSSVGAYGATPYGQHPAPYWPDGRPPSGPRSYGPASYGRTPYGPAPYGPTGYGGVPYGAPSWQAAYGPPPYPPVLLLPPRILWTRRQRAAALLSSWAGQTIMALATHFMTTFFLIVGFAFLLHVSGDEVSDFEADSFTTVVSLWSTPDRVWATVLIGLLIGGALLALGWLTNALWASSAGLAKPHRSAWLAWLCTTAATGLIGVIVWPIALFGGVFFILAASTASLTTGSMWTVLFSLLAIAVVLTGGVGLLFGWLFLSTSRPRVDLRALAEAEEAEARARDEAELRRVQLRGAPAQR